MNLEDKTERKVEGVDIVRGLLYVGAMSLSGLITERAIREDNEGLVAITSPVIIGSAYCLYKLSKKYKNNE